MYLLINKACYKSIKKYIDKDIILIIKKFYQNDIRNFHILNYNFNKILLSFPFRISYNINYETNALIISKKREKYIKNINEIVQMINYFIDLKPSNITDLKHYNYIINKNNLNNLNDIYAFCNCDKCLRINKYPSDIIDFIYYI